MVLDCSCPQMQRIRIKSSLRKRAGTDMVFCLHLSSLLFGIYNICTPLKKRGSSHQPLTQFVLFLQLNLIWVSLGICLAYSAGLLGFHQTAFLFIVTVLWYLADFTIYTSFLVCHSFIYTTSFPLLHFSYIVFIHL